MPPCQSPFQGRSDDLEAFIHTRILDCFLPASCLLYCCRRPLRALAAETDLLGYSDCQPYWISKDWLRLAESQRGCLALHAFVTCGYRQIRTGHTWGALNPSWARLRAHQQSGRFQLVSSVEGFGKAYCGSAMAPQRYNCCSALYQVILEIAQPCS